MLPRLTARSIPIPNERDHVVVLSSSLALHPSFPEASGEQRGEGSLGRTGGAKAYYERGLATAGAIARRFR